MEKDLYIILENKWHYCLKMEKEIRESTLVQVMPELTRGQIAKENKKNGGNFVPKYRAFSILQNKIEEVVNKSTKLWKSIYNLTTNKDGEEEGQNTKEDDNEDKEEAIKKEKVEK